MLLYPFPLHLEYLINFISILDFYYCWFFVGCHDPLIAYATTFVAYTLFRRLMVEQTLSQLPRQATLTTLRLPLISQLTSSNLLAQWTGLNNETSLSLLPMKPYVDPLYPLFGSPKFGTLTLLPTSSMVFYKLWVYRSLEIQAGCMNSRSSNLT